MQQRGLEKHLTGRAHQGPGQQPELVAGGTSARKPCSAGLRKDETAHTLQGLAGLGADQHGLVRSFRINIVCARGDPYIKKVIFTHTHIPGPEAG